MNSTLDFNLCYKFAIKVSSGLNALMVYILSLGAPGARRRFPSCVSFFEHFLILENAIHVSVGLKNICINCCFHHWLG
jgi:hypothetical protein